MEIDQADFQGGQISGEHGHRDHSRQGWWSEDTTAGAVAQRGHPRGTVIGGQLRARL